jgi:hypothetical protein
LGYNVLELVEFGNQPIQASRAMTDGERTVLSLWVMSAQGTRAMV